jgi:hypothetical protein
MKKYIIIAISTLILALTALSACQDMDLSPKVELPDELFWKTPADFKSAVNQLYSDIETFGTKDTDSDIAYELAENTTSNGTLIAANQDDEDWNTPYRQIRRSNLIILKKDSYEGSKEEIQRYVAEARFFRAYYYWRLMRKYNDVPLVLIPLQIESPELYSARSAQEEVEDFILSELEAIHPGLPLQSELTTDENGRVTQGAALALKARVALFAATWAKNHQHRNDYGQLLDQAIQAAEKVISSNEYQLYQEGGEESYRRLFINDGDDAPEAIFSRRYAQDIVMHSTAHSVYWGWRGTPTKKMADMYLCKSTGLPVDKADSGFCGYAKMTDEFKDRDPRMSQTFLIPGTTYLSAQEGELVAAPQFTTRPETRTGYKLWKFMGEIPSNTNSSYYDYHVIRYPEVLLILAEATFEKQGAISDDMLNRTINLIRSRKGVQMPPLTNEFVRGNGLNMLTEIRRERTVELAFEGFRRDDLRRWKTAEVELREAIKGIKYKDSEYENEQVLNNGNPGLVDAEGFLIVEPEEKRFFTAPKNYYTSLPLDEIRLNPDLLPNNPGW